MKELILVPTPIQDDLPLETVAKERLLEDALKDNVLILVEEHKVGRQRWLKWGLPREAIEKFMMREFRGLSFKPGDVIKKQRKPEEMTLSELKNLLEQIQKIDLIAKNI